MLLCHVSSHVSFSGGWWHPENDLGIMVMSWVDLSHCRKEGWVRRRGEAGCELTGDGLQTVWDASYVELVSATYIVFSSVRSPI